jgi:hypothetical protein
MPSSLYCICGAKNEYSVTKPRFCSSCGTEIAKAFAVKPVTAVAPVESETVVRGTRTVIPPRERPNALPKRTISATNTSEEDIQDENEEDDYVDRNEIESYASQLASQISADDFIVKTDRSNVTNAAGHLNRPKNG